MSDILKDPTAVLPIEALTLDSSEWTLGHMEALAVFFQKIHRHLQAGGPIPAQWRGEGTVVGRLLEDAELNASALSSFGYKASANMTRERVRAVTGED